MRKCGGIAGGWLAALALVASLLGGGAGVSADLSGCAAYGADIVPERSMQMVNLPEAPATAFKIVETTPGLVRVAVARSFCAAVSDRFNILVVGSQSLKASEGKELFVFKLGPNGEPAGAPEVVSVPKTGDVGEFPNQVLSLKFHPKLPLLYVWQDTDYQKIKRVDGVNEKYTHLVIYSIDGAGKLTVVGQGARGLKFDMNNIWGDMAVSPEGDRLYVPNLRTPAKAGFTAIGYIGLDPKTGLIAMEEAEEKDPTSKATVVAKKELVKMFPLSSLGHDAIPTGNGYVVGGEGRFISNGYTSYCGVDPENRQGWMIGYYPPWGGGNMRLSAHPNPKIWRFYDASMGGAVIHSMMHTEGFTTGVPQTVSLGGMALYSECVVMPKRNQLAVGAANYLVIMGLTPDGRLTKDVFLVTVNNLTMRALAYSDRLDKLFVVETPKPEAHVK